MQVFLYNQQKGATLPFEDRVARQRGIVNEKLQQQLDHTSDTDKQRGQFDSEVARLFENDQKRQAVAAVVQSPLLYEAGQELWKLWSPTKTTRRKGLLTNKLIEVPAPYKPQIQLPEPPQYSGHEYQRVTPSELFQRHVYTATFTLLSQQRHLFAVHARQAKDEELVIEGEYYNYHPRTSFETFEDLEGVLDKIAYFIAKGDQGACQHFTTSYVDYKFPR